MMPPEDHNTDAEQRIADSLAGLGQTVGESVATAMREQTETLRGFLDERLPRQPDPDDEEPGSPAGDEQHPRSGDTATAGPTDRALDRFDQMWREPGQSLERNIRIVRSNFELAAILMGGNSHIRNTRWEPSEEFQRAWRHNLFEAPLRDSRYGVVPQVLVDERAGRTRAMDTAESGFGNDIIGTAYEDEMWFAARNRDPLLALIQNIPVTQNSQVIPVDGSLPEMLLVSENTDDTVGTKYAISNTGSGKVTQSPSKFTIQSLWSGEMGEDSIVPFVPFIRRQLNESFRLHLASAYYNGDTTNAGTGNINKDDGDPADTKHYLAWDGIRHEFLVDATAQGADASGPVTLELITEARAKLNGAGNDVDGGLGNIDWSAEVSDLLLIVDRDTYYSMIHRLDDVVTAERYGQGATILTGELARIGGMRIISPSYASKTEADGKASDTESNNTKGQLSIINANGWVGGTRRGIEFYLDRVQGRDQFLLEMYTRQSFNQFGSNVAAGVYNITV